MANLKGFNASEHEEMLDYAAIPMDKYVAKMIESENVRNKADTGSFLKCTFQITEGKYKGRRLWTNLNLEHPKSEVMDIAERELGTIMKACGKVAVDDSEELHGIEMELKVGFKDATPNHPASNPIKNYYPLSGVSTPSNPSAEKASPSKPSAEKSKGAAKKRVSF